MGSPAPRLSWGCICCARIDVESFDQATEVGSGLHQLLRRFLRVAGSARRTLRRFRHTGYVAGNLAAAVGGVAHIARHLVGGGVLPPPPP